jgi:hypothetical protein
LADPFPRDDPLPGAYELAFPADNVTIWYTVIGYEGHEHQCPARKPRYLTRLCRIDQQLV